MVKAYRNAADILPPEILAEVQKRHAGLLWVPMSDVYHRERRHLVEALLRHGVPVAEVADLARVSRRWIQRIRKEMKEETDRAKESHSKPIKKRDQSKRGQRR